MDMHGHADPAGSGVAHGGGGVPEVGGASTGRRMGALSLRGRVSNVLEDALVHSRYGMLRVPVA